MGRYDQKNMRILVRARDLNEERIKEENEKREEARADSVLEQAIKDSAIPIKLLRKARQDVEKELEVEVKQRELDEANKSTEKETIKSVLMKIGVLSGIVIGLYVGLDYISNQISGSKEVPQEQIVEVTKEGKSKLIVENKLNHEGWEKALGYKSEEMIYNEKRWIYEINNHEVKIKISYRFSEPDFEEAPILYGDTLIIKDNNFDGTIDRLQFIDLEYELGNKIVNDSFTITFPETLDVHYYKSGITLEEGLELREELQKSLQEFERHHEMDKKVKHYIVNKEGSSVVDRLKEL